MMTTVIEIDGTTEARGRNGWFQISRMEVCTGDPYPGPNMIEIRAWSKREADCAPVILVIPARAALELAHEMTRAAIRAAFSLRKEGNREASVS